MDHENIIDIASHDAARKAEKELTQRRIDGLQYVIQGIGAEMQIWENEILRCKEEMDAAGVDIAEQAYAVCKHYQCLLQQVWDGTFIDTYSVPASSVYKQ